MAIPITVVIFANNNKPGIGPHIDAYRKGTFCAIKGHVKLLLTPNHKWKWQITVTKSTKKVLF